MKEKLLTLAVALLAATGAWAQNEFPFDGLYYMVTDETAMTVELISYNTSKPTGTLTIPTTVSDGYDDYTVTSIGDYALENCSSLTCVAIPASVTNIGNGAFRYCSALKRVIVWGLTPPSVKSSSFTGTHSDLAVYVPAENLEDYKAAEVWKDFNLQALHSHFTVDNMHYTVTDFITNTVEIDAYMGEPEGVITIPTIVSYEGTKYIVTSIGDDTFNTYPKITEVILPEGLTRIGILAFNHCTALTEINIPNNVTIIDRNAFSNCTQLNKLRIGNNLETIGANAFDGCSALEEINILATTPPTVASDAFTNVSRDIPVYVPQESLEDYKKTLWGVFNLKANESPIIVDGLEYSITDTTARHMELIGYETMPEGTLDIPATVNYQGTDYTVTAIGSSAFEGCYAIEQVNIPAGVTLIGSWAFDGCSSLAHINVAAGNTAFSSEEGVLFNKDKTRLIMYPVARPGETYTVPDGVTNILSNAFERCGTLVEVTLPASLTVISNHAFAKCAALSQIVIPDGVGTIGSGAFMNCFSLGRVIIGSGVTSIDSFTFMNCSSLTEITVLAAVPPTITSSTFDGLSLDIPVYVPAESLIAYQEADVWKEFTSLQAISSGLDTPSMPESIRIQGGMLHNPNGLTVIIYDLTGRLVYSGNATTVELPAGIYVVSCNGANRKAVF